MNTGCTGADVKIDAEKNSIFPLKNAVFTCNHNPERHYAEGKCCLLRKSENGDGFRQPGKKFALWTKVFPWKSDKHIETQNGKEESDMRIEAYTQVQQVYQSQKVSRSQKANGTAKSDNLQISSFGKDIQTAKAAVAGSPDIREELTAPIKAKVENGTYEVSKENFADRLLQKYEEMR